MDILQQLREQTHASHIKVEKVSNVGAIIDYTISQKAYAQLLKQNYIAYYSVEKAILKYQDSHLIDFTKHNERISTWIAKDIEALSNRLPVFTSSFSCNNQDQALGCLYVLEGSLLGGAMIASHISQCKNINTKTPQFYAAGSKERAQRWRDFIKLMKTTSFSETQKNDIITGALLAFDFFYNVFKNHRVA